MPLMECSMASQEKHIWAGPRSSQPKIKEEYVSICKSIVAHGMNLQMRCTVNREERGGKSVPHSHSQVTWSIICICKAVYSSPVQTVRWDLRFQLEGTVYAALGRPQSLGPGVDYSSSGLTLFCSCLEQWFSVWTETICSVSANSTQWQDTRYFVRKNNGTW